MTYHALRRLHAGAHAEIIGSGPSLLAWLEQAPAVAPAGVVRFAVNETTRFVRAPYTCAADPVDRYAHEIPARTLLLTTQEAIDNARRAAPACPRCIVPIETYRGSIILAGKAAVHMGITSITLIGVDGGSQRADLPWISPPSICDRAYGIIRRLFTEWAGQAGVAIDFWEPTVPSLLSAPPSP